MEIKFSKFDNTPWGFRLTGGSDCNMPLTVVKVSENSIAEQVGLRENDIIVKINNIDTENLSHDEAHEVIMYAGNNFVATIFRNETNQCENSSFGTEFEPLPLSEPSFTNDTDQVPILGTKSPINLYKPFSEKTFTDIPPLENPLILSKNYTDNFQTINQKEWKEFSSKKTKMSCIESSENVVENHVQQNTTNVFNHIDIKEIEKSAKDTVDQNVTTSSTVLENVTTSTVLENGNCEIGIENQSIVENACVSNNISNCNNLEEKVESKTMNSSVIDNHVKKQSINQETLIKKEVVSSEIHSEKIQENKIEMYEKSKEISLEDAKVEAMKAANVLSQQAKANGINTFEGTKMGTIDAFNTLSQNMKHKCLAVPCEAHKLQTQSQTDLLLKTFFIHLTDVMVALTQMITHEDSIKCSKLCNPYCTCMAKSDVKIKESEVTNIKQQNIKEENYQSLLVQEKEENNQTSKNFHTENVLKEVIENIQSATGVDVMVDGKDPLEWLADIDEKNSAISKVESCVQTQKETETKMKVIEENIKCTEEIKQEKIMNSNTIINEVKEEHSMVKENTEISETSNKSKETIGSGWDVKVPSKDPQTPITDEYVFRLDIKLKGKLPDGPAIEEVPTKIEEPKLHEDLSIVRRPVFSIGDVKIERTENKIELDDKIHKIDNGNTEVINIVNGNDKINKIDVSISQNKDTILNEENQTSIEECNQTKIQSKLNGFNANITDKSSKSNEEFVTNTSILNSTFANNKSISNDITASTNTSSSEVVNSANSFTALSDTTTNITNAVLGTTSTIISSIPASANSFTNDIHASAYNYASSCSVANGQEGVHETVLTSTKERTDLSQEYQSFNGEDVTFVEEVQSQVKTMAEPIRNFATICNDRKMSVGDIDINGNEEDIGKPGLTNGEVADILSGASNVSKEQHVIGLTKVLASHMNRPDDEINSCEIKDMTPIVGFLRDSEVFKALNEENLRVKAERLQEGRKKWTTFLQKPTRPVPFCKRDIVFEEPPYKVNIRRVSKENNNDFQSSSILTEGLFLVPEVPILIPEPQPQYFEAPEYLDDSSFPDLEDTGVPLPREIVAEKDDSADADISDACTTEVEEEHQECDEVESTAEHVVNEETVEKSQIVSEIDDSNDENLTVEEQLAKVQQQLVALSMLPATIQQTLDLVTKKITKMVTKSTTEKVTSVHEEEHVEQNEEINEEINQEIQSDETVNETKGEVEENVTEESEMKADDDNNNDTTTIKENDADESQITNQELNEAKETKLDDNPKIEEGKNIHKLRKDLIEELTEEHVMRQVKQRPSGRVGRPKPAFGPLTPQERPIVLPGGRRWRGPRDAFTDSFIAETMSGQAEVIKGKAIGSHVEYIYPPYNDRESNCHLVSAMKGSQVNFMKYAKPPVTLEHLKGSSVFKMIHDEEEPAQGILARPEIVLAESDYREKCRSVTPSSFNKQETEVN